MYPRVLRCSRDRDKDRSGGETDTGKTGFDCVCVNWSDLEVRDEVDDADPDTNDDDQRRWFW